MAAQFEFARGAVSDSLTRTRSAMPSCVLKIRVMRDSVNSLLLLSATRDKKKGRHGKYIPDRPRKVCNNF
ncbi:MAG: hypothetical protein DCC52_00715 [Chloroflexi bacterium]|nr:MAG: hypothetical protein DCC52_00715 [Chloroflexota bacterium]